MTYLYMSAGLTKPEAAPETSSPFLKLIGNYRYELEGLLDEEVNRTGV